MQREDLDKYLQVLTAIMTDLTVDVGKTLDYLAYSKEKFSTHLFTIVRTDNHGYAGSRITVNERFVFSISNKIRKLEYYPKIHNN